MCLIIFCHSDGIGWHKSGHHWIKQQLVWRYQAITWASTDLLLIRFSGVYPKRVSKQLFCMMSLKITVYPKKYAHGFALLCFVVVIHWLIFPHPSGLLHWHCGNLTIAPVPAKQPWWIWINTSCEFIMNDCITTTKQSTTKPCAYFLGYTV